MSSFSVLLSVYHKESAPYLDQALCSVWDAQLLRPSQVVLVADGPLTPELYATISQWETKLGEILNVVRLPNNVGLAAALNEGLKHCTHELIARMDTDDVSVPERFKWQYSFMIENPGVAVCSGLIEEWSEDLSDKLSERKLPLYHKEIKILAKSRNPISHPAAMFRKSAVLGVGGYPNIYPEDYALWGRMLAEGYRFANLPNLLLQMRVGNALTERRGLAFLKGEVKVFRYLYAVGFISKYEMSRNIVQRAVVRLSPTWLKRFLYKYAR